MSRNSANGPGRDDDASWATETLPLAVRRELLERELAKLGFRRKQAHGASAAHEASAGSQHQQHPPSSHPQADAQGSGDRHAD